MWFIRVFFYLQSFLQVLFCFFLHFLSFEKLKFLHWLHDDGFSQLDGFDVSDLQLPFLKPSFLQVLEC